MNPSRSQIVVTLGPASADREMVYEMFRHQMDVVRLNFSWGEEASRINHINNVRWISGQNGRDIPILIDLPGRRVQKGAEHTYDSNIQGALSLDDIESIKWGIEHKVDYFAISFVGRAEDVLLAKQVIKENSGQQRVVAKIERSQAVEFVDEIIEVADAIMIARGDLGAEVPLERVPFIQDSIIKKCKAVGKPVITATQMLFSMTDSRVPTRAEVTDVANAILQGSDAVMLSDETAHGKYPVEAMVMMEKIVCEAERHMDAVKINPL
jgi:pyruvate kinase